MPALFLPASRRVGGSVCFLVFILGVEDLDMPIYEYKCEHCDHELEALQKMSDDPLKKCPECGNERLIKKISAAGFRLKGGGWYETDFKSGKKKNLAGDTAGGSTTGGGSSGGASSSSGGTSKPATGGSSAA